MRSKCNVHSLLCDTIVELFLVLTTFLHLKRKRVDLWKLFMLLCCFHWLDVLIDVKTDQA